MSHLIRKIHEELRAARLTRKGATMRPEDVPRGLHKEYPRMPRMLLPAPQPTNTSLEGAISGRRSFFENQNGASVTLQQVGTLLGLGVGISKKQDERRHYPSGGALFPIETYLIGNVAEKNAVFHYHPKAHALEHLWDLPVTFSLREIITTPTTPIGETLIVFTAVFDRSSKKYGNLSYIHSLLEAGHMAQNLLLVCTALEIRNRPIAAFDDEKIQALLDIPASEELPVYAVTISTHS